MQFLIFVHIQPKVVEMAMNPNFRNQDPAEEDLNSQLESAFAQV